VLSAEDVEQLRILVARRDQHNQRLYRDLAHITAQLDQARAALASGRLGRLLHFARRIAARIKS
jgi:hypothetical protein